jgi:hypothetical protein
MANRRDTQITQELPAIETARDLYDRDPLHIFSHRYVYAPELGVRLGRSASQWSQDALGRCLAYVQGSATR